ncbi:hypothetical protein [Baekduia sp. Peel2402]|uniref:hypothetical protein n=1 Tax=Baekduia sp. Peel2402 TaxID=3458296 RepID=UPI00403E8E3F
MLDDLPDVAGDVLGGCFPGCTITLAILVCTIGAPIAFAIGETDAGWTMVTIWAIALVAVAFGWWWRRADA